MTTKTHYRTCLCPPPGSATWHWAHFVLKIFAPIRTKVKERERQCVVSKTSHEKTQKKEGMLLKEILHISYPWRRLLRELLQTKPSADDDDSFFCDGFSCPSFLSCLCCEKNFLPKPSKKNSSSSSKQTNKQTNKQRSLERKNY